MGFCTSRSKVAVTAVFILVFQCLCFVYAVPLPSQAQNDQLEPVHASTGRHLLGSDRDFEARLQDMQKSLSAIRPHSSSYSGSNFPSPTGMFESSPFSSKSSRSGSSSSDDDLSLAFSSSSSSPRRESSTLTSYKSPSSPSNFGSSPGLSMSSSHTDSLNRYSKPSSSFATPSEPYSKSSTSFDMPSSSHKDRFDIHSAVPAAKVGAAHKDSFEQSYGASRSFSSHSLDSDQLGSIAASRHSHDTPIQHADQLEHLEHLDLFEKFLEHLLDHIREDKDRQGKKSGASTSTTSTGAKKSPNPDHQHSLLFPPRDRDATGHREPAPRVDRHTNLNDASTLPDTPAALAPVGSSQNSAKQQKIDALYRRLAQYNSQGLLQSNPDLKILLMKEIQKAKEADYPQDDFNLKKEDGKQDIDISQKSPSSQDNANTNAATEKSDSDSEAGAKKGFFKGLWGG